MTSISNNCFIKPLLKIPQREIFLIAPETKAHAAVFLIKDKEVGGILINSPPCNDYYQNLLKSLEINFIFLPSHFGACALNQWQTQTSAELIAHENECAAIDVVIDIPINEKSKLTRTIDFIPIPGRSRGSCALYLKNLPGTIFFGPILQRGDDGWPTLIQKDDDYDFESRLFSALGLKDLNYQYAFLDDYDAKLSKIGPEAGIHIRQNIEDLFED